MKLTIQKLFLNIIRNVIFYIMLKNLNKNTTTVGFHVEVVLIVYIRSVSIVGKFRDLTGMKFGYLTVLEMFGKDKYNKILWKCECECGNETIMHGRDLVNGGGR